ncbi:MAG: energy transducer TonB [Bacteroidales bacterium]|nr:energy transducer TonB [Bacteroidales bacterium]
MKAKKSKRANLENLRTIFIQIGLVIALSVILAAFEWKSNVEIPKEYIINTNYDDLCILPPVTRPKAEVPKKVKVPKFEITPDEFEVPEVDLSLLISEIGEGDAIEIIDFKEPEEVVEEPIYYKVEEYPKFMGKDDNAFRKYIIDNIKFPVDAQENGLTGKVQAQFVVDLDGSLSQIKILRGVHSSIDKEVLRVIQNSPKWEPAIQAGKNVRAMYGIIISFELQ